MVSKSAAFPRFDADVLLAEDNPVNLEVARRFLEVYGCRVQVADNGREALRRLAEARFDLVLMDCHMPDMDGFEATRSIREQGIESKSGRRLPVVALTANVVKGTREKCLDTGMDDYVTKPFSRNQLEALLKKWLGGLAIADAAPDSPARSVPEPTSPPRHVETTVLDPATLDSIRAMQRPNMPDILGHAIRLYRDHSPTLVNNIETALAERNGAALKDAAHALKSASANLGALNLAEQCAQLEQLGAEDDLDTARENLPVFLAEFERVLEALEKIG